MTNAKGKQRLVIDLRYVNQYQFQCKFKYEGLNVITSLFHQGDYMIAFDLKSGYHHVDIHEDSWSYLGFSWSEPGGCRQFVYFGFYPLALAQLVMYLLSCLGLLLSVGDQRGKRQSFTLMMVPVLRQLCRRQNRMVLIFPVIFKLLGLC